MICSTDAVVCNVEQSSEGAAPTGSACLSQDGFQTSFSALGLDSPAPHNTYSHSQINTPKKLGMRTEAENSTNQLLAP